MLRRRPLVVPSAALAALAALVLLTWIARVAG
jgi:hypothetical protein